MSEKLEDNIVECDDFMDSQETTEHDMEGLKNLRAWAMKNMKQYFVILITYGVWALLFSYAYMRGGYSALAISIAIAVLYRLDMGRKHE